MAAAIASLSLSALGVTADSAHGLTLESTGKAFDAVHDGNSLYPSDHAFWLPGLAGGSDFIFKNSNKGGSYDVYSDGSDRYLNFTGKVVSENNTDQQWNFDIWFKDSVFASDGKSNTGKDKLELTSDNYVDNGGTIDPTTWQHWDLIGFDDGCSGPYCSKIVGKKDFKNLNLSLTQRPGNGTYTFQSGVGANGKNLNDGLSGWFQWDLGGTEAAIQSYKNTYSGAKTSGIGDINVDLESTPLPPPPPPVSVPEPSLMVGLGLTGAALLKRKKQQEASLAIANA